MFAAKGIYSNWDRLGNIAAAVDLLQTVKKQVSSSIRSGYQSKSHKAVDPAALVWRIADKSLELGLQEKNFNRARSGGEIPDLKATVMIKEAGYRKFESTSLASFNKKIEESRQGILTVHEVDEIPALALGLNSHEDEDDGGEESVLHDNTD